ncbi:MAG: hypothetical protein J6M16_03375 [Clostridia bacterium]|nr:hypothetical protein [Clostridia bacterium]
MRKILFVLLIILLSFSACSGGTDSLIYPEFEKFETAENYEEQIYDVLSLSLDYGQIEYTDVGSVENGKYILNGLYLPKSTCLTLDGNGNLQKGKNEFILTYNFYEHSRYSEGVIIYKAVPFAYYLDSKGEAYVSCIDEKIRSEYGTDKTYADFIKWAGNYNPDHSDYTDLLSR